MQRRLIVVGGVAGGASAAARPGGCVKRVKSRSSTVLLKSGRRSYYACRILLQKGFKARNLSGSYRTWKIAAHLEDR
jgi:rhodanese-related sulfurtransferase